LRKNVLKIKTRTKNEVEEYGYTSNKFQDKVFSILKLVFLLMRSYNKEVLILIFKRNVVLILRILDWIDFGFISRREEAVFLWDYLSRRFPIFIFAGEHWLFGFSAPKAATFPGVFHFSITRVRATMSSASVRFCVRVWMAAPNPTKN